MGTKRLGVAVAVLDGYLYAIGGSDGQCPLSTGRKRTHLNTLVLTFFLQLKDMIQKPINGCQ